MSDFDYGNARLRAMKSRLLSQPELQALAEAGSVTGLLTALTETPYREAVEAALIRLDGLESLAEALRNDLVATAGRACRFFRGETGQLASLLMRRYDVHNVKALLRGLARRLPANEILAATLPVGDLRPPDLAELARSPSVRAAVDLLATWAVPLAYPLLRLSNHRRGGGEQVVEAELALDRWHWQTGMKAAGQAGDDGRALVETFQLEIDAANLLTALRLVGAADVAVLREHYGTEDIADLFVGPGRVPLTLLAEAARRPSVADAVATLAATPYAAELNGALEQFRALNRLSVFEWALARRLLQHAANFFARDPLGIGVLIGYTSLKTNEVANLRAIAQGLSMGEKADRIQVELMWVNGS